VTASLTNIDEERDSWFFILGCQRSGTTLVRLILECHSRIECWDEQIAYGVLAGRRAAPPRTRARVGLKVPCLTEQLADDVIGAWKVVPENTPNTYRGQRLVFMVRDVRDTVASMCGLRLGSSRPWLDTHLMGNIRAKEAKDDAFRRRYAADLAALRQARHAKLAYAAFYWRYKTNALLDYLDRGFPVLLMRYEDLVGHAQLELLRLCGFLQVPWEPALLEHHTQAHTGLGEDGLAIGQTDPARAIDEQSLNRWQGSFTESELHEILAFAGELQTQLYPSPALVSQPDKEPTLAVDR
jgi:hypothetical protein